MLGSHKFSEYTEVWVFIELEIGGGLGPPDSQEPVDLRLWRELTDGETVFKAPEEGTEVTCYSCYYRPNSPLDP